MKTNNQNKLNVAIIGCGVMGSLHARIYSNIPNVKLVAVCDISASSGKKLASIHKTKYYRDYKEMLTKEDIKAVSITVPTALHKDVALFCIEQGVNVLVEKPLAPSVREAKLIAEAALKKKVILTVGHIERFNPAVLKLKDLIKKGLLGRIVAIVVKRVGLFPPRVKDINVVTDLAVHDLDIVCSLLDKYPKSIFATGGKGINDDRIDYADIFLDFNITSCYLQVNWMTPIKIRTLSVTGTLGYCELDYITQELTLYKSNYNNAVPEEFKKFVAVLGKPEKVAVKVKKEEPLKLEILNFVNSAVKGRKPLVSPEEGINAVKLSEIVLESLSEKKLIKL
ncbi:Gfo/Idh/MocA family oxidoreductase [Candidatus Daviesbacteria bacterium]|nr:Gfo/Idh/MocA family oxidoreductase [Candidatus Daviesbacteria bacterium]